MYDLAGAHHDKTTMLYISKLVKYCNYLDFELSARTDAVHVIFVEKSREIDGGMIPEKQHDGIYHKSSISARTSI